MNFWEFLNSVVNTPAGMFALIFAACTVIYALVMFKTGNFKFVMTKDGQKIFTTAKTRSDYDVAHNIEKVLSRHITDDAKKAKEFENKLCLLATQTSDSFKEVKETIQSLQSAVQEQALEDCKLIIYNKEMPYASRVQNAHRFLRLGGNGGTRDYVINVLKEEAPLEFKGAWLAADEIRGTVAL